MTLGLLTLVVTTGALSAVMPLPTAHVLGSLTFGIGFVVLTIGRSALFTENFLIPVRSRSPSTPVHLTGIDLALALVEDDLGPDL